jgi:hypothetical protein
MKENLINDSVVIRRSERSGQDAAMERMSLFLLLSVQVPIRRYMYGQLLVRVPGSDSNWQHVSVY